MCIRIYLPFCFTQSFVPIQRLISEFIDRNAITVRRPQSCKRPDPRPSSFVPTDLIKTPTKFNSSPGSSNGLIRLSALRKKVKQFFSNLIGSFALSIQLDPIDYWSESEFQISNRSEFLIQVSIALGFWPVQAFESKVSIGTKFIRFNRSKFNRSLENFTK